MERDGERDDSGLIRESINLSGYQITSSTINTTNPMHLLSRFLLFAAVFVSTGLSLWAQAANTITIDLIKPKINGQDLFALSMDKATDLLGKPDHTYKEEGTTTLVYFGKGLQIKFEESSGELMCSAIFIYLSKGWVGKDSAKFTGTLTKGLDENWKVKKFLEEFSELKPKDMAMDEGAKSKHLANLATAKNKVEVSQQFSKLSDRLRFAREAEEDVKESTKYLHRIEVTKPNLILIYEQNSKFILQIAITK